MIRKSQLFLALAGLVGMNAAMAVCNTTLWGAGAPTGGAVVGTPVPGNPTAGDADGVVNRYFGLCGLRANAAVNYVQDGTPTQEAGFIARFYVFPAVGAGTAKVFNALNTTAAGSTFSVDWNGTGFDFKNGAGSTQFTVAAPGVAPFPSKWYTVELKYTDATDTVAAKVKGNGSATQNTGTSAGFTTAGPDTVQFGYVSGTAVGEVHVDAYESRRSTDIGRLCRGDANGNGLINVGDRGAVTTEVVSGGVTLASGNPDCNENGVVNAGDRGCISALVLAATVCDPLTN